MLFDTGANGSLNHRDVESHMFNTFISNVNITVADGGGMKGCMDGKLKSNVVNTANYEGFNQFSPLEWSTTTTNELAMELLSFDKFYRDGRGVHCKQLDVDNGVRKIIDRNKMTFWLPGFIYAMTGTEVEVFTLITFLKMTYNLNTQDVGRSV